MRRCARLVSSQGNRRQRLAVFQRWLTLSLFCAPTFEGGTCKGASKSCVFECAEEIKQDGAVGIGRRKGGGDTLEVGRGKNREEERRGASNRKKDAEMAVKFEDVQEQDKEKEKKKARNKKREKETDSEEEWEIERGQERQELRGDSASGAETQNLLRKVRCFGVWRSLVFVRGTSKAWNEFSGGELSFSPRSSSVGTDDARNGHRRGLAWVKGARADESTQENEAEREKGWEQGGDSGAKTTSAHELEGVQREEQEEWKRGLYRNELQAIKLQIERNSVDTEGVSSSPVSVCIRVTSRSRESLSSLTPNIECACR